MALLLPKLRSHFAEFLNNASPVGLRILSSSTCVGLRYGYIINNSGFSWQPAHTLLYFFSIRITSSDCTPDLPDVLLPRLHRSFHSRLVLSVCVPTVLLQDSTGISTCYPSTTSFDLALGPDLPRADQLYPGNLRYSAKRILTSFSLLIPAFSLLKNPLLLSVQLRLFKNAPLPMNSDQRRPTAVCFICFGIFLISSRSFPLALICIDHCSSLSFGSVFQPRTFSAQDLSTSELLRTLLMDGCF